MTTAVVICTHRHPSTLVESLDTVRRQIPPSTEVLVVRSDVAPGTPLPEPIAAAVSRGDATVVEVEESGVARARQAGLERATADVVLFLDDDVVPANSEWYDAISAAMEPDDVGAAGGTILPAWPAGGPPRWAHPVIATYYGERHAGPGNVHLPFGANMAVRRTPALAVGGFAAGLGHQGVRSGLHEETELCRRLRASGLRVVEVPDAVVVHEVRVEQVRLRWVWRRALGEGWSDATRDRLAGTNDGLRRAAKLAGLVMALPFALVPRWRAVIPARALVNAGYLRTRGAVPAK